MLPQMISTQYDLQTLISGEHDCEQKLKNAHSTTSYEKLRAISMESAQMPSCLRLLSLVCRTNYNLTISKHLIDTSSTHLNYNPIGSLFLVKSLKVFHYCEAFSSVKFLPYHDCFSFSTHTLVPHATVCPCFVLYHVYTSHNTIVFP